MKEIDLETARGLLARAVLTKGPEFVYNPYEFGTPCAYVPLDPQNPGSPEVSSPEVKGEDDPRCLTGCLVGVALALAGYELTVDEARPIHRLAHEESFPVTGEAVNYLREAQKLQDAGSTWGNAYDAAEAFAARIAG